jgi:methylglutaconyl-CoA hydratase
MHYETISIEKDDHIFRITLNRPEVRNAFNDTMIAELTDAFEQIRRLKGIRVVVLEGAGKAFCAGADIHWMQKMIGFTFEDNLRDAIKLANLLEAMYNCTRPVVAKVQGAAIGGGTGLVAVADIAIASIDTTFSFSEVKIGLVPACISPYVIRKVGEAHSGEFFITGERLSAQRMYEAGLVNRVVPPKDLDGEIKKVVGTLLRSGPKAVQMCKELVRRVPGMPMAEMKSYTARAIAELRVSDEGQEGMQAFFQKRKPRWAIVENKER